MSNAIRPHDRRAQVEAIMDAVNARDFDALAQLPLAPDFEFRSVIGSADGSVYRGLDGLREWAAAVDETWDGFRAEPVDVQEVGDDRAVVVLHATGRAKVSGVPLDVRPAQVWTWLGGELWRNEAYSDRRQALRAAGVRT